MINEVYWKAVTQRDGRFDGAFLYAVGTTGIYCKPSCSARTPRRENVVFFSDPGEAETVGFRACKRCRPSSDAPDSRTRAVICACAVLDSAPETGLEELGLRAGMSPTHLQRVFKEIIGVSPKKYSDAVKMENFKAGIKAGGEVVDAMYEAGFGSSSRLYENISGKLGMTPATYRKGGKGMKIEFTVADCELGKLLVARTRKGICAVNFGDDEESLVEGLRSEYPEADVARDDGAVGDYLRAIVENLRGDRKRLVLPLDLQATSFQLRVWEALREIPYGETVSYADIAKKLGNPKAVRAVAGACAANRVALVIPCHRVVKSNGDTSGYKWGKARKEKLLANEKVRA